jgi:hypothetical protein
MNANPDAPSPIDLELFTPLDGVGVRGSWRGPLAGVLLKLGERTLVDQQILSHLARVVRTHRTTLASISAGSKRPKLPEGVQEKHPIAVALLKRKPEETFPALDTLLALLCELALNRQTGDESHIRSLGEMLRRNLDEGSKSRLVLILGDATTIPEVLVRGDQHLENGFVLYPRFETAWKSWLRDRLRNLIWRDPAALRRAFIPPALAPSLEATELTLVTNEAAEPDDTLDVTTSTTEPLDEGETERTARTDFSRARAAALVRASQGDLLAPPDHLAPKEVIVALAQSSIGQAHALQRQNRMRESEPFVALALAIATGLRESDLADVRWDEDAAGHPTISEIHPVLLRPIVRAPNAVVPDPSLATWLAPSAEHVTWPLPPKLHQLLLQLVHGKPAPGDAALPWLGSAIGKPYVLREVVATLQPGLALGASMLRQAFAASLARHLGPDVAQLAFGDTFSMSAAATYYTAPQQIAVITKIRDLQTEWFGESSAPSALDPPGVFGSRLVLTDEAARHWPAGLRYRRRALAHSKDRSAIDAWVEHRNFLAAALCAATGHRPVDALGQIDLDQVIPEYGLIMLSDKMVDPLRRVRIAATGAYWITELRSYLDRLIDISSRSDMPEAATLAAAILRSETPLFHVPGSAGPEPFTAAMLRASMPELLRSATNHYRHRLNQQMQDRGVDPELRYAQLGWIVSPAHATADLSPVSARDLGAELGPIVDAILLHDGWFAVSKRRPTWHWNGVPLRPWRDWDAVARTHEAQHRNEIQQLRQSWHEKGRSMERDVLPRLANAIREFLPALRLDESKRRLGRAPNYPAKDPISISEDLWALICDRVRQQDARPAEVSEAAITRILLHRLFKQSHREGLTWGSLPRRPIFSLTSEPSPFLPGSGLAVRHAELLRQTLIDHAREGRAHDKGVLAQLSVVLFSPYRDMSLAKAAVNGAVDAMRGQQPGDVLRVPATLDHKPYPMVFGGVAALLLARRGTDAPKSHAPNPTSVVNWLMAQLPTALTSDIDGAILDKLVSTLRTTGRLELSGPERLLMLGGASLASTTVERCLATDDRWPVRTRESDESAFAPQPVSFYVPESTAPHPTSGPSAATHYARLTALLNPDLLPRETGATGDGHRGWRSILARELELLQTTIGSSSTLGLVTGFALHRLRYGGLRKKQLGHRTLHNEVTQFARPLLNVVGPRKLQAMDGDTLRGVYLAILVGKPPRARAPTMEALRTFQTYLEEQHHVDAVSFGELASFAGPRVQGADPGLLSPAEVDEVFKQLERDLHDEQGRADASPDLVRLAELRLLFFVLLEASSVRPASIHGLVFGDLKLFGHSRDFLHLHKTGDFSSVKTAASIGFIPLEGELWTRARPWVLQWIARERALFPDESFWGMPVFANILGTRRRFSIDMLQSRLGELLRWITNEGKARVYWLRKSRLMARHRAANDALIPRARDVQAALCDSGHVLITTPLCSYISDPAIAMAHSLKEGRRAKRAHILATTELAPNPLDAAWRRHGGADSQERMTVVFDRMSFVAAAIPARRFSAAPPQRRQLGLLPSHLDHFARAMQRDTSVERAALAAGLSPLQTDRLQTLAVQLLMKRGQTPWFVPNLRHPRAIMRAPRRLQGTEGMFKTLARSPTAELVALSDMWAERGHADRVVGDSTGLILVNTGEVAMARSVLHAMGIDPDHVALGGNAPIHALQVSRPNAADPGFASEDRRTLTAALHWILAMVWLQQRLIAN